MHKKIIIVAIVVAVLAAISIVFVKNASIGRSLQAMMDKAMCDSYVEDGGR